MKQRLKVNIKAPDPLGKQSTDIAFGELIRQITQHTNRGAYIEHLTAEITFENPPGVKPADAGSMQIDGNTTMFIPAKDTIFKNWLKQKIMSVIKLDDWTVRDLIEEVCMMIMQEFGLEYENIDPTPESINLMMKEFGLPFNFSQNDDGTWNIG